MFSSLLLGLTLATADSGMPPRTALPYCHTGAYGAPPSVMLALRHADHAPCRKRLTKAFAMAPAIALPPSERRSVQ